MALASWTLDRLKPYGSNARKHSDEQVDQIAKSIKEFGFTNPILVGKDGTIIAGHGRLLAAKRVGLKEVPVIVLGHLSDTQRRALVIADNQLALNAGWDFGLLSAELRALRDEDFDLSLVGFSDDELASMLDAPAENDGLVDADEVPEEPAETYVKPGDLFVLGEHRILCGDSTKASDVARLVGGRGGA